MKDIKINIIGKATLFFLVLYTIKMEVKLEHAAFVISGCLELYAAIFVIIIK